MNHWFYSLRSHKRAAAMRQLATASAIALLLPLTSLTTTSLAAPADPRADKFMVVDCLLPGQLRRLGGRMTYLTPRRPTKTTASDCEIRGGEYVQFDRANYATALKVWLPAAKEGDAKSQTYVGEIFEKGLGTTADYTAAAAWYRKAAEQGYSRAMLNLGYLYEKGLGVQQDMREALNWYRRASGLTDDDLEFASSIQVTMAEKDKQITALQQESQTAKQEAQILRRRLKQTQQGLAKQERELQATRSKLEGIRLRLKDQEKAIGEVSEQELQAQRDRLSAEENQLTLKRKQLEQLEAQLAQQATRLTAKQRQAAEENSDLEKRVLQQQVETQRLQRRLRQVSSDLDNARAGLKGQKAKDAVLVAQLNAVEKEHRDVEKQLVTKQQQTAVLQASLDKARQRLDETAVKYSKAQSDLERRQALYEAEKRQLMAERDAMAEKAEALTKQSKRDLVEIKKLRNELKQQEQMYAQRLQQLDSQYVKSKQDLEMNRQKLAKLKEASQAPQPPTEIASAEAPSIELIEPPVTLTRGAYTASLQSDVEKREVIGRVNAPAGLLRFNVNETPAKVDDNGLFRVWIPIAGQRAPVNLVVVDKQGQRVSFNFDLFKKLDTKKAVAIKEDTKKKDAMKISGLGKYYALVIGSSEYTDFPDLRTPVADATKVARVLQDRYGYRTKLLTNPTRYSILSALNELRSKLTKEDNLLIYYAGHGEIDDVNAQGYWLPVDAERDNTANWISTRSISDILNAMAAKHILVVADSCYSGAMTRSALARLQSGKTVNEWKRWFQKMAQLRTRMVLSSGGEEPVNDGGGGQHSVFANAFINALMDNDRILDGYTLYTRIAKFVQVASKKLDVKQTPQYAPIKFAGHESGEFLFQPI